MALGKALQRCALLAIVFPALLGWLCWVELCRNQCSPRVHVKEEDFRLGFDPAPAWFAPALQALPRRELNATELEVLDKEGVVPVRGLVANDTVLAELRKTATERKQWWHGWRFNGLMNALVRHSPLPALASSSLRGKPVAIWNSQVEPRPARSNRTEPYPKKPWQDELFNANDGLPGTLTAMSLHDDVGGYPRALHTNGHPFVPLSSIFLALTDIPFGLRFIAGSHVLNSKFGCPHGPLLFPHYECFDRLWSASLGERTWDLKAGDAVLFWGETYHWTHLTERPRQALSIRYIPSDMFYTGRPLEEMYGDQMPPVCSPLGGSVPHPVLHPPQAPEPGTDPATGSRPGRPWPAWPECPEADDSRAMLRWLRFIVQSASPWPPECGPTRHVV